MSSTQPTPAGADRLSPWAETVVFQARLNPSSPAVPAPADQTLLQSFAQAGHELLSSCRNGTCRACLRQLSQGQVRYRIEWPGLSAEEKAQGWVLPCVAYPRSDITLANAA